MLIKYLAQQNVAAPVPNYKELISKMAFLMKEVSNAPYLMPVESEISSLTGIDQQDLIPKLESNETAWVSELIKLSVFINTLSYPQNIYDFLNKKDK
ncbi:hypothetical protein ABK905_14870 [Acerihabitans sp. KWT182]|uniref:Uncharacterized protein n=1 Tax=Acerihabitans sp. KWT182 TaxID=3157919 RepID=A0AAU7Q6U7_9GAMM